MMWRMRVAFVVFVNLYMLINLVMVFSIQAAVVQNSMIAMLESPTHVLMTQGGDDRLHIDPTNNMNKYFTSPIPLMHEISRSSCTSSRPTAGSFDAAERLRLYLLSQVINGDEVFDNISLSIRNRIKKAFIKKELDKKVHVICTPSGSDAEMLFSVLALLRQPNDYSKGGPYVSNIIVASSEVGSGTAESAQVCHFSAYTPLGPLVKKGVTIQGVSSDAVQIISFAARHASTGQVIPKKQLEKSMTQAIEQCIAQGKIVVVHMVHSSKTGIGTPSLDFMKKLKQTYQDSIIAVVDAAQGRCTGTFVSELLDHNICVLLTGSKFFAGVPFSGAVLIPDGEAGAFKADALKNVTQIPVGLQDYFSAYDVDKSLIGLRKGLLEKPNIGLLLRWESALYEIERYFSYDQSLRSELIAEWAHEIRSVIDNYKWCIPLESIADDTPLAEIETVIGGHNTVMSFMLKDNKGQFFSVNDLKMIHGLMAKDLSLFLPEQATDKECTIAKKICLIGQPVTIIGQTGVLRIALSAPVISDMAKQFKQNIIKSVVIQEVQQEAAIFEKLGIIVRYFDTLISKK